MKESKSVSVGCGFVLMRPRRWQIAAGKSQLPSYSEGFPSITVPVVCLRLTKLPPLQNSNNNLFLTLTFKDYTGKLRRNK